MGSGAESVNDEEPRERPVGASRAEHSGPVADAEAEARRLSTGEHPLGPAGPPINRRSPFFVGFAGAAGVAVTYGLVQLFLIGGQMLMLIGLSLFIALGLEPVVSWLVRRRVPRAGAVALVLLVGLGIVAGFLAVAIPPLVEQAGRFAREVPAYLHRAQDPHTELGQLNLRFDLAGHAQQLLGGSGGSMAHGVIGAGQAALSALSGLVVVVVLVVYFLVTMPQIRRTVYRCAPASRRARVVLLGDEVVVKIGGYVLGNAIISVIAGVLSFLWLWLTGVPYPLLLAVQVALLDVVPVAGSVVAGVIATLAALSASAPVALATAGFFVAYRLLEDYVLQPKIIGRTVHVPAVTTVLAVLLGGAWLGIVGAVVAIPVAGVIVLLLREITFPHLDRT